MTISPSAFRTIAPHWPITLCYGVIATIIGAIAYFFPFATTFATGLALGWALLLAGLFGLVTVARRKKGTRHWVDLVTATSALLSGLLVLFNPMLVVPAFVWAIVLWLGLSGIAELGAVWHARGERTALIVLGLCDIGFAILLLLGFPGPDAIVLAVLVSLMMIGNGLVKISIAWRLRAVAREQARHPLHVGTPAAQ